MGPATKNRYPPYKKGSLNGAGNKKPLPTLQERKLKWGRQQKTVTHPTRKEA